LGRRAAHRVGNGTGQALMLVSGTEVAMRQRRIGARIGFGVRVVGQLTEPWLHPPAAAGQGSWRYFTFGEGDGLRPGAGLGLSAG
jgi:hypothetical protein